MARILKKGERSRIIPVRMRRERQTGRGEAMAASPARALEVVRQGALFGPSL